MIGKNYRIAKQNSSIFRMGVAIDRIGTALTPDEKIKTVRLSSGLMFPCADFGENSSS
ncbi:MAG: hypothetical protein J0653_05250 [Deltaproteobacteria bacterium]|nr:hypothetical protein [Deltaproteobacteria bacterium]